MHSSSPTLPLQPGRESWVDALRALALILLITSHCCDPFNSPYLPQTEERAFWGSVYLSITRPCVPLFVMITGYLLLPCRAENYGNFYKKRIFRVLWPFLIWSVIYNAFPWCVFLLSDSAEAARSIVTSFFAFAEPAATQEGVWQTMWHDIIRIPFDFSGYNTHMWYVFLLVGLYLFIPFISPWCAKATNRQKLWLLGICAAASLVPFLRFYGGFYGNADYITGGHIFGVCEWNDCGTFYYFSGFIGYLVGGMYLGRMKELSWRTTLAIALPLLAVGYGLTLYLFEEVKTVPGCTAAMLDQPIWVCSFNVVMMTLGMFLIGRKLCTGGLAAKAGASLGVCCFGIYMVHYFFVGLSCTSCTGVGIPTPFIIPASTLLALLLSWMVIATLKRVPGGLKWLLG